MAKHLRKNAKGRRHLHIQTAKISVGTISKALGPLAKTLVGFEAFVALYPPHSGSVPPMIDGIPVSDGFYETKTGHCSGKQTHFATSDAKCMSLALEPMATSVVSANRHSLTGPVSRLVASSAIRRCKIQRIFYAQNIWRVKDVAGREAHRQKDSQAALAELLAKVKTSTEPGGWSLPGNQGAHPGDTHPFYRDNGWQNWRQGLTSEVEEALEEATLFSPSSEQSHRQIFHVARSYMDEVLCTCTPENRIVREQVNQTRSYVPLNRSPSSISY